ncbi:MAG TPA: hypothetical protein VF761_14055 [Gemmatimonadaceae bacterium]
MRVANEPASESAPGKHRPAERPLFEPPRIRRPDEGERPTSWMTALCYAAHAIVHVAYARAGAGRTAWLIAARKLLTITAALLLGAFGGGLSAVAVAAILAVASGVQLLWSIWDRAHTDARSGGDPGPGLSA